MAKQKITVQDIQISIDTINDTEYFSLTDIAKKFGNVPNDYIKNWLKNSGTLGYLAEWEKVHNSNYNNEGYRDYLEAINDNRNISRISVKQWIELTKAIGLRAAVGRYGGTYAHKDIAINFCYWLSPTFQIYFIKEFQILKENEAERLGEKWDVNRYLSKVNYHIHTDSIKTNITAPKKLSKKAQGLTYASEADVLNVAVFGMTAKEWRLQNPESKGNIRDNSTAIQLQVLANLEVLNAKLIEYQLPQKQRIEELSETAKTHFDIIENSATKLSKK